MADTRVQMAPESEWREFVAAGIAKLFEQDLGPAIRDEASRIAPKLSGRLASSIDDEVRREGDELPYLIVGTFPDDQGSIDYAAAVEFGFHGLELVRAYETKTGKHVRAHVRRGNSPEQPYLRPALYRVRSA